MSIVQCFVLRPEGFDRLCVVEPITPVRYRGNNRYDDTANNVNDFPISSSMSPVGIIQKISIHSFVCKFVHFDASAIIVNGNPIT